MAKLNISPTLRRSMRDRHASFTWGNADVKYARKVWSQRPWTTLAIIDTDLAAIVAEEFNADHDLSGAFDKSMIELGDRMVEIIDDHDWGFPSRNEKKYRSGRTYGKISDSEALRDSMVIRLD